jgi:Reverse transcriptase (RNA-dependent DNA polymerase)
MRVEIEMYNKNSNWIPIRRDPQRSDIVVLSRVWAMWRRRRLTDGVINKWKARLNIDGSKQEYGINFWETYAPVAMWISIRFILCEATINGWKFKTFHFIQAFPQAPSEVELYIDIPKGCKIERDNMGNESIKQHVQNETSRKSMVYLFD